MKFRLAWWLGMGLSAAGYLQLVNTPRTHTALVLPVWGGLFLLYGAALYFKAESRFRWLMGAAIVFRLIGMTTLPTLSDDLYRFIWDGRLLAHGINPFLYLPTQVPGTPMAAQAGLTEVLFHKLNSPEYFTVYPPLLQVWFGVAAYLSTSEPAMAFWLRLPILVSELATFWLLYRLLQRQGKDQAATRRGVLLYALNPLAIVELTANIHYEGVTICFVLAGLYFYKNQKTGTSAAFLGLAAGVKLLPLIFLPALLNKKQWLRSGRYLLIVGVVFLLPFLFFFNPTILENISTSLDLYFRRFEFNASVYYLLRAIGTFVKGYNPIATIGPFLGLVSVALILIFSWWPRFHLSLAGRWLGVLTAYLVCATTVHPWYVVPLIALCVLTPFRFPVVWSVVLPLTYIAYGQVPFSENLWLVVLEYLVVGGWMIWEIRGKSGPSEISDGPLL